MVKKMRQFNNYSNGYNVDTRISEIRGLTNDYGLNLNKSKDGYNEEKVTKLRCNFRNRMLKKNN